jgi:hypothetical protein
LKIHDCLILTMILSASVFPACTTEDRADPAAVVTLFDIRTQLAGGSRLIDPINVPMAGRFSFVAEKLSVDVSPAFSDGQSAAYVTTEYWKGFSKVWVQPMYVMVRETAGKLVPFKDLLPIFSVGPESAFYSPYWHVFFAVVPNTNPTPNFRSTRDVLNSGYRLISGPPRLCSLAPKGTDITGKRDTNPPLHPLTNLDTVGPTATALGWVDGYRDPVDVVSSGDDRFTYNEQGVVDEAPLYVFRHQSEGSMKPTLAGLPSVGGRDLTGAPSGSAAPKNRPAFGSHWRLNFVDLPSTAGVLVPLSPNDKQLAKINVIQNAGLTAIPIDGAEGVSELYFRPVLDVVNCQVSLAAALKKAIGERPPLSTVCGFLDSQAKIQERLPPEKVLKSDILATCPWVTFHGEAVPGGTVLEPRP